MVSFAARWTARYADGCSTGETASAWLARVSFEELRAALKAYGESARPENCCGLLNQRKGPTSTHQLADIVASVLPRAPERHPATKTFQAIRIVINQELELEAGLAAAVSRSATRSASGH